MSSSIGRVGTVYLIINCLIEWTWFGSNQDLNINAVCEQSTFENKFFLPYLSYYEIINNVATIFIILHAFVIYM